MPVMKKMKKLQTTSQLLPSVQHEQKREKATESESHAPFVLFLSKLLNGLGLMAKLTYFLPKYWGEFGFLKRDWKLRTV